ncbi:MAG: hypothetical protein HY914_19925 [Desulfomonile tiedjei]|nr:hypothetical protein [Desulfomonile tiedjei]
MAKPKIDAKEALEYLRAGLDDYALMQIYNLSAKGLQSLFQKLVSAGAISQAELDQRMPSFVGTAVFAEDEGEQGRQGPEPILDQPPLKGARPLLDAREVLIDIKAGMGDADLMEKYRLSSKGLQSLFDKLVEAGAIREADLDQRMDAFDATVDLLEVIRQLGIDQPPQNSTQKRQKAPRCPACGALQTIVFDDDGCAECGIKMNQSARRNSA